VDAAAGQIFDAPNSITYRIIDHAFSEATSQIKSFLW
jgi:hypothetical protein